MPPNRFALPTLRYRTLATTSTTPTHQAIPEPNPPQSRGPRSSCRLPNARSPTNSPPQLEAPGPKYSTSTSRSCTHARTTSDRRRTSDTRHVPSFSNPGDTTSPPPSSPTITTSEPSAGTTPSQSTAIRCLARLHPRPPPRANRSTKRNHGPRLSTLGQSSISAACRTISDPIHSIIPSRSTNRAPVRSTAARAPLRDPSPLLSRTISLRLALPTSVATAAKPPIVPPISYPTANACTLAASIAHGSRYTKPS